MMSTMLPMAAVWTLVVLASAGLTARRPNADGSADAAAVQRPGQLLEGQVTAIDTSLTFTAYLPPGYDASRRWPLLFVFDPRGRGTLAAKIFQPAAERYGWIIVSSDNTRSDGPWEPNARALEALWPDALSRYAVDPRRIYAAGFSGGATVAWVLSASTGEVAGVIAAGQPLQPLIRQSKPPPAWFGAAGRHDFNYRDMLGIREHLAEVADARTEFFDGAHRWLGEQAAIRAVGWLEMLAMRDGRRPTDLAVVGETLNGAREHASALEAASRLVEAADTYRALVQTYEGLVGTDDLRARIADLTASKAYTDARKAEQRAARYERARLDAARDTLGRLMANTEALLPAHAVRELRITSLQRDADRGGAAGDAATRTLETIFVQTAFYLPNELQEKKRFRDAALMLEVATVIHPARPGLWYTLARAHARAGSTGAALSALERAADRGFNDAAVLASEGAFDSLRSDPRWRAVLARISGKAATER